MADNKVVCRLCKFSSRFAPKEGRLPGGRLFCTAYKQIVPTNKTCPKAEALGSGPKSGGKPQTSKRKQWKDPRYDV